MVCNGWKSVEMQTRFPAKIITMKNVLLDCRCDALAICDFSIFLRERETKP